MEFFQKRNISLLHQAPYSPDLNLCDRWLFAHVKQSLREVVFNSHIEVEAALMKELRLIDKDCLRRQVDLLMSHCQKVVECGGCYVTPH